MPRPQPKLRPKQPAGAEPGGETKPKSPTGPLGDVVKPKSPRYVRTALSLKITVVGVSVVAVRQVR